MIASSLSAFLAAMARPLGNHLWQSTLFAGVIALLALALRKHQARIRYGLWLAASAKFLIPFSLLFALGSHLMRPSHPIELQAPVYVAVGEMSQPFTDVTALSLPAAPAIAPSAAVYHSKPSPLSTHRLPTLLAALWLCGVVTILSSWSMQWLRIRKYRRKATLLHDGREIDTLRRVEQLAGIPGRIEILSSRASMEPGVLGIAHPVILWPEGISRHFDDTHLETVLAHEVCHVKRRDNLTAVIHMWVEALFWFHPLVWWMESQLVKERERACDEAVQLLCNRPQAYAESILKVCEFCAKSPLPCVSGITGADLKQRITTIMTGEVRRRLGFGAKCLLIAVSLMVVAVPMVFGRLLASHRVPVLSATPTHQSATSSDGLATPAQMAFTTAPVDLQSAPPQVELLAALSPDQDPAQQPVAVAPKSSSAPPCTAPPRQPLVAGPNMPQVAVDRANALDGPNALAYCHDYLAAQALYMKVVDKYPNDASVLMFAGQNALQAGLTEEGAALLGRAVAHFPNRYSWSVRMQLAQTYIKLGRWQELDALRFDTRKASLAGDPSLRQSDGYQYEHFSIPSGEFVDSFEYPTLHGPNRAVDQFRLIGEKDRCTGFTPHIDLELSDNVYTLEAYTAADTKTRLASYSSTEPSYQTIRADMLSRLAQGPLVAPEKAGPCTTGPMAGGQLPPVTFSLRTVYGVSPVKIVQVLLNGQPIALNTPVPVSGMWMQNLAVVLQNTSTKSIVQTSVRFDLLDTGTGQVGSPRMSFSAPAGIYPDRTNLKRDGTNIPIPLSVQGPPISFLPSTSIEVPVHTGMDGLQIAAYGKAPVMNIELSLGQVFFSDDCKWWEGLYYIPAPLPQVWKQVTVEEFNEWHPSIGK